MKKILGILVLGLLLSSCYSEKIVGKKILCLRLENNFNFEDVRSYEFISESSLVRTFMWFNESLEYYSNNLSGDKKSYKLTSDTIEVYQNKNIISEVISRKDLTIDMPWDNNWNLAEGECKIFNGDIREEMKKIHTNKTNEHKNNLFDRINNFFDKILYKI